MKFTSQHHWFARMLLASAVAVFILILFKPSAEFNATLLNLFKKQPYLNYPRDIAKCFAHSVIKRDAGVLVHLPSDAYKPGCSPLKDGPGCLCNEKTGSGIVSVRKSKDEDCKDQIIAKTVGDKKKVQEEIKQKFGSFKENCFPKPSGGCRCNEKDASGQETVKVYNREADCKVPQRQKRATAAEVTARRKLSEPGVNRAKNADTKRKFSEPAVKTARDPVRERAQANYAKVLNELNSKFQGLKKGCFPRPKGCLCVLRKDADGREVTERRMNDKDCKCQPGDRHCLLERP